MEPASTLELEKSAGPWSEFPDSYWEAYFGKQAPYYLQQLHRLQQGRWPAFHVHAFFLGFLWMVYRRMYVVAFCALLLILLETTVEEGFMVLIGWEGSQAEWTGRLVALILNLLIGTYANRVYLWDARRNIRQAIAHGPKHVEELRLANIAEHGGTSWVAVVLIIVAAVFIVLIMANMIDLFNAF